MAKIKLKHFSTHRLLEAIRRVDGADAVALKMVRTKTPEMAAIFTRAYVKGAVKKGSPARRDAFLRALGRADLAGSDITQRPLDPDPADKAHRGLRGANSAVRSFGASEMPDVSGMDLHQLKATAGRLGAYAANVRTQLAPALLARLRAIGADMVAAYLEQAWREANAPAAPSDDEALRAGAAKQNNTDEAEARRKLMIASKYEHAKPPATRGRSRDR